MILFFPTGTDAPLYHPPIMTGVIISLNIILFIVQMTVPDFTEAFMFNFGTVQPWTWLTSAYLHGGVGHLIGNMIFLLIYGMIVEGKIGWWKFAIIYNLCAFAGGIIELCFTFFLTGASLGASGAIFALLGICFLWAPENQIRFTIVGVVLLRVFHWTFEASIEVVAFFFVAMQFLIAAFTGFQISSAMLHLIGLVPGLVVGYWMLKARRVNCDGYDFFTIRAGKKGEVTLTVEEEKAREKERLELARKRKEELEQGLKMVDRYIEDGHYGHAFRRFHKLSISRPDLVLKERQVIQIINGLESKPNENELYQKLLYYYLENYDRLRMAVQFKLAKSFLDHEEPRRTLKLLGSLANEPLSDSEKVKLKSLAKIAKQQIASGVIEIRDRD